MAAIVGWGHTKFGKLEDDGVESLLVSAVNEALDHSGLGGGDVDEAYVSQFNSGLDDQGFPASLIFHADESLRYTPVTHVENACASGSAAVHQAVKAVESGMADVVLVAGVEKMTHRSGRDVNKALVSASYLPEEGGESASFAGIFGQIAKLYFQRFGDQSEALAHIAAKNHKNGCHNPLAHIQKDFDAAFCLKESEKNPMVAAPLKRTDCSMVSDGASALIVVSDDRRADFDKAIAVRSMAHVNEFLPMSRRDMTELGGVKRAWSQAFERAGIGLSDLDFVETHDCFTIAELMQYEAMGLVGPGEGWRVVKEGWAQPDGKLPVNLSGGLKSKGHPIGATGVSMHVHAARQLVGEASGLQADDPALGGVFNMGGAGVANYCTILERTA
ncbi:MAG: acetyl-CoA acetyltransferase [Pseudomonadota bacterium]